MENIGTRWYYSLWCCNTYLQLFLHRYNVCYWIWNLGPPHELDQTALQPNTLPSKPLITESPSVTHPQIPPTSSHPSPLQSLYEQILTSHHKLFFIKFTPANTLRSRWYLIQVDIASTEEQQLNPTHTNKYWCIFHAKHFSNNKKSDHKKSDKTGRWWPLWHKYTFDETHYSGYISYSVQTWLPMLTNISNGPIILNFMTPLSSDLLTSNQLMLRTELRISSPSNIGENLRNYASTTIRSH